MNRQLAWTGVEAVASGLLSIVSAFVIARHIGPAEVGIGAAAVSIHVLLWVALNALFADALVQRLVLTERMISSAFWTSIGIGVAAMGAQTAIGAGIAAVFGDPRLASMTQALALSLPLVAAGGIAQGLLIRHRRYRALAMRTVFGQGLGTLVGVLAAFHGAGGWALASQQLVASAAGALVLLAGAGWRPQAVWRWRDVRALLVVALPLTGSTLVQVSRYRLFAVLIGATAGPAALGEVHVAFRLVDTLRDLCFTAMWRIMLPDLSRLQHDRPALLARVDRLLRLSSCVTLPLCGALAVCLVPFVAWVLGPDWTRAGEAALPLTALTALLALLFPSGVALVAVGQARFTLYANLANFVLIGAGILALRPATALGALLIWCAGQCVVAPYSLLASARALRVRTLRPLRGAAPVGAAVMTAVAAAWLVDGGSIPAILAGRLAIGAVIVLPVVAWVWLRGPRQSSAGQEIPVSIAPTQMRGQAAQTRIAAARSRRRRVPVSDT